MPDVSYRSCRLVHELSSLQATQKYRLSATAEADRMRCLPELHDSCVHSCEIVLPIEARIATTSQVAIDPRTGEELRFGPAMAEKAIGVDLPALRKLFADIKP